MTNLSRHCLSYLKENKVHYYFDGKTICFPCPICPASATMDPRKAIWSCLHCDSNGTLIQLSNLPHVTRKVYNPVAERRAILRSLRRLSSVCGRDEVEFSNIIKRLGVLLEYWQLRQGD